MDKLNQNLTYIVNLFGELNEEIDDDDLDFILEELETITNKTDNFKLAQKAISLGKPQILEFLVDENEFIDSQIKTLLGLVVNYENQHLDPDDSDSDSVEDIEYIIKSFRKILRTPQGYKRKKN